VRLPVAALLAQLRAPELDLATRLALVAELQRLLPAESPLPGTVIEREYRHGR